MEENVVDWLTRKKLSIDAAAEDAGVSRRTIYNWLHAGKLEYTRTAGGGVRICADTLHGKPQREWTPPSLVGPRKWGGRPKRKIA
jgi:excisionase family DNA binding protein